MKLKKICELIFRYLFNFIDWWFIKKNKFKTQAVSSSKINIKFKGFTNNKKSELLKWKNDLVKKRCVKISVLYQALGNIKFKNNIRIN